MNINIGKCLVFSFVVLFCLIKANHKNKFFNNNNNLNNLQKNIFLGYSPKNNFQETVKLGNGQVVVVFGNSKLNVRTKLNNFIKNQKKANKNKNQNQNQNKENIFTGKK